LCAGRATVVSMKRSSILSLVISTALGVAIVADGAGDRTGFGTWGLVACALVYLVAGLLRGEVRRSRLMWAQVAGVVGFGAVAGVALVIDPGVGRYLVAAGWLAHAGWDLAHFRAGLVVPTWYALACAVVDAFVGVSLAW
jgi:hypothetical protein